MSDLINEIRRAQVRAGEQAVIDRLNSIGLGNCEGNAQTCTTPLQPKKTSFVMSESEIKELLTLAPKEWLLLSPFGVLYKTTDTEQLISVLRKT